jgi:hypothetical protein
MYLGLNNLGLNYTSSAFNPMDWFTNSEQGAWYDADNPADGGPVTAYQEATGITPVTAPGQGAADCVIGFLADKRLGLVAGADQVTNGDFADATGWTLGDASVTISGGALRFAATPNAISASSAVPAAVVGTTYLITVVFSTFTAGTVRIARGGATADFAATATGSRACRLTATSTGATIVLQAIGVTTAVIQVLPGNHATQATTASKPVLTARYNLLTQTEVFSNAAWAATGLLAFGSGSVANTTDTTDPLGGNAADFICENSLSSTHALQQSLPTLTLNTSHTAIVHLKAGTGSWGYIYTRNEANASVRTWFNLSAGTVGTSNAGHTASITAVGNGWYRCKVVFDSGASDLTTALCVLGVADADASFNYLGNGTRGIYVWGADLRTSADAALSIPAYQRVTDASNYDTAGFPCRIKFDGFDDSLQTAAVDFTGTDKMTVVAGIQKLSDAATGTIVESGIGGAAGSFSIFAPIGVGANFSFRLTNTGGADERIATTFTSPTTCVLSMALDNALSGAENTVKPRINGAVPTLATNADLAAAGAFANLAINIGRRNGASLPLNAYLTRLIICGATRSDSQIVKAERSTALKMALQY